MAEAGALRYRIRERRGPASASRMALAASIGLLACTSHEFRPCEDPSDCRSGEVCVARFCRAPIIGGVAPGVTDGGDDGEGGPGWPLDGSTDSDADTRIDDAGSADASVDAGLDAPTDAGTDAGADAGTDAGTDAGADAAEGDAGCLPAPEVCDGVDNDCNAATADGSAELGIGQPCDGPDPDTCRAGTLSCIAGVLSCGGDGDYAGCDRGCFAGGSGTLADPYLIDTPERLDRMRRCPTKNFALESDLDLAGTCPAATVAWSGSAFDGTLDGRDHAVANMTCDLPSRDHVGFVPVLGAVGSIRDLRFIGAQVSGTQEVGIVAGENRGVIQNVDVSGRVVASIARAGGIVGYNLGTGGTNGRIEDCDADVTVTFDPDFTVVTLGGIVGSSFRATVRACTSSGDVSGDAYVGGIAGDAVAGAVETCTSDAGVVGRNYVGGIVGTVALWNAVRGHVAGCSSTGAISGSEHVGGIAGAVQESEVADGVFSGTVGGTRYVGGVAGDVSGSAGLATVVRSSSSGVVQGNEYVGGITGLVVFNAEVREVHSVASVTGDSYVGGILGRITENGATDARLADAYFEGVVTGGSYSGGIVGQSFSEVSRVWVSASVGAGSCNGAIIGWLAQDSVTGAFFDEAMGLPGIGCGSGSTTRLTTEQMRQQARYVGFDFATPVWTIDDGVDFPRFAWE